MVVRLSNITAHKAMLERLSIFWLYAMRQRRSQWFPELDFFVRLIWYVFASINPHHYGHSIATFPKSQNRWQEFEHEAIKKIIRWYGGSPQAHTGMVITGSSEGNITMAWYGKSMLLSYGVSEPVLLVTQLTHESVLKGADMAGIPVHTTEIDDRFGMSLQHLESKIRSLYTQGVRGVLVCFTLGYKKTGSSDRIFPAIRILEKLKRETGMRYFCWIDAAFDGLLHPFTRNPQKFLKSFSVGGIVFDFHKHGFVPYAAAALILKQSVLKRQTYKQGLLESRSLLPSLLVWVFLSGYDRSGLEVHVRKMQTLRRKFFERIVRNPAFCGYIMSENSTTLTLISTVKAIETLRAYEDRFPIRCHTLSYVRDGKVLTACIIKVYFLHGFPRKKLLEMTDLFCTKV